MDARTSSASSGRSTVAGLTAWLASYAFNAVSYGKLSDNGQLSDGIASGTDIAAFWAKSFALSRERGFENASNGWGCPDSVCPKELWLWKIVSKIVSKIISKLYRKESLEIKSKTLSVDQDFESEVNGEIPKSRQKWLFQKSNELVSFALIHKLRIELCEREQFMINFWSRQHRPGIPPLRTVLVQLAGNNRIARIDVLQNRTPFKVF